MKEALTSHVFCLRFYPQEKLKQLVWGSQAFADHPKEMEALWSSCGDLMFSLGPLQKHLGLSGEVLLSSSFPHVDLGPGSCGSK